MIERQLFVYVSSMEDDLITIFGLSPHTGGLTRIEDFAVAGGPAPLATDPSRRWLFVGQRAAKRISSYERDSRTGRLSPINSVQLKSDPCYITTDRGGRFLFSAYYGAGRVAVHQIDADGSLVQPPIEWRETALRAHYMQADPSNQFVFVPHIAENGGANAIFQFRFDDTTGQLTANSPEKVVPSTLDGPRHFCFHPSRALIYCSNEQSSSVTVYAFDVTAGTLRDLQKLSTLPADFNPENTCSQIQITPDGRFLYAPNRGHDSIAIFTVDETSGLLKVVGHQPTEREPRAFSVDGDGHYLYAAGLETGKLASYRIEPATGALQPMAVYPVGDVAMWVLAR